MIFNSSSCFRTKVERLCCMVILYVNVHINVINVCYFIRIQDFAEGNSYNLNIGIEV